MTERDGEAQDARVIPVPGDEEQWGSLLEVNVSPGLTGRCQRPSA